MLPLVAMAAPALTPMNVKLAHLASTQTTVFVLLRMTMILRIKTLKRKRKMRRT
jgi:hypothetical protein